MKSKATILIDNEVLEKTHELGVNVSKACETALKQYIIAFRTANEELRCREWDLNQRSLGISPQREIEFNFMSRL